MFLYYIGDVDWYEPLSSRKKKNVTYIMKIKAMAHYKVLKETIGERKEYILDIQTILR